MNDVTAIWLLKRSAQSKNIDIYLGDAIFCTCRQRNHAHDSNGLNLLSDGSTLMRPMHKVKPN